MYLTDVLDLTISDWQKDGNSTETTRELSYIKPLNGSIGKEYHDELNEQVDLHCIVIRS